MSAPATPQITTAQLKGWTKKLTKKEKAHLRNVGGVRTTWDLKEQLEFTLKRKAVGGVYCFDCYLIARKLGFGGEQ